MILFKNITRCLGIIVLLKFCNEVILEQGTFPLAHVDPPDMGAPEGNKSACGA